MSHPICYRCGRTPDEIQEYVDLAHAEASTPDREARADGTYNPLTDHFCCTTCYFAIGMPTAPHPGWKAP